MILLRILVAHFQFTFLDFLWNVKILEILGWSGYFLVIVTGKKLTP